MDKLDNSTHIDDKLHFNDENDDTTEDSTTEQNKFGSRSESRSFDDTNELVGKDLTAAQLYESIEDNFAELV